MKLQIFSDIHLEMGDYAPVQTDADVVVLAGDIHIWRLGIEWIRKHFGEKPVIYVAGNHEYHGSWVPATLNGLRRAAEWSNICVLENESIQLDGWTFLGCTLWTDFSLWPNRPEAMLASGRSIRDFEAIRGGANGFNPEDSVKLHGQSVNWLKDELQKHRPERTVVVTHHAPSEKSLSPKRLGDILNGAVCSRLDDFVNEIGVSLWVHGHTHFCVDYKIGKTRVFSNQRGYPGDVDKHFRPGAVIELSASSGKGEKCACEVLEVLETASSRIQPAPSPPVLNRLNEAGQNAEYWDEWWKVSLSKNPAGGESQRESPAIMYHGEGCNPGIGPDLLIVIMREYGLRTVLCAGSGISKEPHRLAMAGFDVKAFDISPIAVAFAVKQAQKLSFIHDTRRSGGHAKFMVGNLLDTTVCPGPFDVVIERCTVQTIAEQDRAAALEALSGRLSKTGIFLSHFNYGSWSYASEAWFREHGWTIWKRTPNSTLTGQVAWLISTGMMFTRLDSATNPGDPADSADS